MYRVCLAISEEEDPPVVDIHIGGRVRDRRDANLPDPLVEDNKPEPDARIGGTSDLSPASVLAVPVL
jgi:hypothetical protein